MKSIYYIFLIPLFSIFVSCNTEPDPDSISDFIYHANGTFIPIKNDNLDYHGKTPIPTSLRRTWYAVPEETTPITLMNINKDGSLVYYTENKIMNSGYIDNDTIKNNGRGIYQIMYCGYDETEDCLYMVYRFPRPKQIIYALDRHPTACFLNEKQLDHSPVFNEENHTLDPDIVCPPNTYWAIVDQESKNPHYLLLTKNGLFDTPYGEYFSTNEEQQWFVNKFPSAFFTTDENNLYLNHKSYCHIYKYRIDKTNNRLFLDDEEYYLKNMDKKK